MSDIIAFKPRKPPAASPEELPHYHSIVCDLAALTPQDRLSVIAAACDDDDWKELFELAVYSIVPALSENQNQEAARNTIRHAVDRIVEKVVTQAIGAAP
jgi:hypothetical protein